MLKETKWKSMILSKEKYKTDRQTWRITRERDTIYI
jgi:hypothetical protein